MERRGFHYKDSLNVEVFLYDEDEVNMRQLHFLKENKQIVNDLFIPDQTSVESNTDPKSTVETYFQVDVDEEIETEILCEIKDIIQEQNIYLGMSINCDDTDEYDDDDEYFNVNIYETEVEELEDCE
jgi:hypothetical protein